MATIHHGNPYTHEEHTRISKAGGECAWCGQERRVLYNYDRMRRTGGGLAYVCNLDCAKSYSN